MWCRPGAARTGGSNSGCRPAGRIRSGWCVCLACGQIGGGLAEHAAVHPDGHPAGREPGEGAQAPVGHDRGAPGVQGVDGLPDRGGHREWRIGRRVRSRPNRSMIGVSTLPGSMTVTRTPAGRSSHVRQLDRGRLRPHLVAPAARLHRTPGPREDGSDGLSGDPMARLHIDNDRRGVGQQQEVWDMPSGALADFPLQEEPLRHDAAHQRVEVSEQQPRQLQPRLVQNKAVFGGTPETTRVVSLPFAGTKSVPWCSRRKTCTSTSSQLDASSDALSGSRTCTDTVRSFDVAIALLLPQVSRRTSKDYTASPPRGPARPGASQRPTRMAQR